MLFMDWYTDGGRVDMRPAFRWFLSLPLTYKP